MAPGSDARDAELAKLRRKLASPDGALDPIGVYEEFIKWTTQNYDEKDPNSGLREILEEATNKFKKDDLAKVDLRYVKFWSSYIRLLPRAQAITTYEMLVANGIGTVFSPVYQEVAALYEQDGRLDDADAIFRKGIKRQARPLEWLRAQYKDFRRRNGRSARKPPSSTSAPSSSSAAPQKAAAPSASSSSSNPVAVRSTPAQRYAVMLEPNPPGKRPEKYSFNFALLWTDEGGEYSIQEARARSMGLLDKKWNPPPASETRALPGTVPLANETTHTRTLKRKSVMGGGPEPTMTINTKEALADVFGMYNSPERTMRHATVVGGKHAPLMKVDITPSLQFEKRISELQPLPEEIPPSFQPGQASAFKPFVDASPVPNSPALANSQSSKLAAPFQPFVDGQTPKSNTFRPFVDSEPPQSQPKKRSKLMPYVDPENAPARAALGFKDTSLSSENNPSAKALKSKPSIDDVPASVPLKAPVFTPAGAKPVLAPLRDAFTDDHGRPAQPRPKLAPVHERAKSYQDEVPKTEEAARAPVFFRQPVFTPAGQGENAYTPNAKQAFGGVFTPQGNAFTPQGGGFAPRSKLAESVKGENAFTPKQNALVKSENAFTPKQVENAFTPKEKSENAFTPRVQRAEEVVERNDSVFKPKAAFEVARDKPRAAFTPFRDDQPEVVEEAPMPSGNIVEIESDEEEHDVHEQTDDAQEPADDVNEHLPDDYSGDFEYDNDEEIAVDPDQEFQTPPPREAQLEEGYDDYDPNQPQVPYSRCGPVTVMTPIAERTFEFTRSTFEGTPSRQRLTHVPEDDDEEYDVGDLGEEVIGEEDEEEQEPEDEDLQVIEEKTGTLSLADSMKVTFPNPCNPFDPEIVTSLLSLVTSDGQFHDLAHEHGKHLDELQKFAKKARKTSGNPGGMGVLDVGARFPVSLAGQRFSIVEKIGEGAFGAVFRAEDRGMRGTDEDDEDEDDDEDLDDDEASLVALKVVRPRNLWEYHVLRRLHQALPMALRPSVVLPHALFAFRDESFLVLEYAPYGTLLSVVNRAAAAGVSQQGGNLDELLVIFFTAELLRLLEGMHRAGFIHGDLKIDNVLVRMEDVPGGAARWDAVYSAAGAGGWACKGIKLADFGRAIDTRLFPRSQRFIAEWEVKDCDCPEIREGRPWTYETDYFGLAGIAYCMLFGKYITPDAVVDSEGRRRIATPLKRYWQGEIWTRLFDILLNPRQVRENGELPLCDEIGEIRGEMEEWLQRNCNRAGNTLKGLLKKVEMSCLR
ncbi:hypothetical protein BD626DRAFT_255726 [Schizophyllum amplum]|uniref:Mad3/BUB1 homology region 1-domain-containing protein n=1 Tax=Schizophyllum amplum TaxID=97359 RepID=A0A550CIR4_9AGAR|nr:hypothetical protein BD626DRAFT_255726 [Auriculariopsis ampla]